MRTLQIAVFILTLLTLPLMLLSALGVFNAVNPMTWIFTVSFEVNNGTSQRLWVTPIGTVGPEGSKRVLPQYLWERLCIPVFRQGHFLIEPGTSIRIVYDWDDINFSELLFENEEGELRQLVVDPTPTENQYHSPATRVFHVEDFGSLEQALPAVVAVAQARFAFREWILNFVFLVPVGFFTLWVYLRRATQAKRVAV